MGKEGFTTNNGANNQINIQGKVKLRYTNILAETDHRPKRQRVNAKKASRRKHRLVSLQLWGR